MLSRRMRYILMGLVAASAFSFAMVSCMSYMESKSKKFIDLSNVNLVQQETPKDSDPVAVIKTSGGDIKAVLYPEYAPKAVESFTKLAENGYYDNTYIYSNEPGLCFNAGSAEKDGSLGDKYDKDAETVEQELNASLWPFRGAICSIPTGVEGSFWDKLTGQAKTVNGSCFMVLDSVDFTEQFKKELLDAHKDHPDIAEAFIRNGGVPNLSQKYTVFAQTYEGFDVIEKFTAKDMPPDAMIESIEISTYGEEKPEE